MYGSDPMYSSIHRVSLSEIIKSRHVYVRVVNSSECTNSLSLYSCTFIYNDPLFVKLQTSVQNLLRVVIINKILVIIMMTTLDLKKLITQEYFRVVYSLMSKMTTLNLIVGYVSIIVQPKTSKPKTSKPKTTIF